MAPFLIAPRAGKLADRAGERPLVVCGLLLQAAGLARIAAVAAPRLAYPVMLAPMIISGAGFAMALPAVTKAVVGSVPPADIGKASGTFSTMRQLGGAFGVAILAAVFAAAGSLCLPGRVQRRVRSRHIRRGGPGPGRGARRAGPARPAQPGSSRRRGTGAGAAPGQGRR